MEARPRPLTSGDAKAIHEILLASGSGAGLPVWPESMILESLRNHRGWALADTQGVVAFVLIQVLPDAWEILHLATHPRGRRQGLMRRLLDCILPLRASDKRVWLEVHEANNPACRLYESIGFKEVGRRVSYYSDGGAAVLYNLG